MASRAPVPSDHFDGRRFHNPTGPHAPPFSKVWRMLREPRAPWPGWIDTPARTPPPLGSADAAVTFIGHSTFLVRTPAGNLLTDPMYSRRAGPLDLLGPLRVRPPAVRFEDLPPIATVLLSHNHYDHCDLPTLRRLAKRFDPVAVTPLGNGRILKREGFRRFE
jgi:glyoxylase-like metal-dependent hydrolase (beta-lactamase superfamily II)